MKLNNYDFCANIHLYRWKEMNILLDVNSGAVHILDDLASEAVRGIINCQGDFERAEMEMKQKYTNETKGLFHEIKTLYEAGAIFSSREIPRFDFHGLNVKALCLNVAHHCNMSCRYCFAAQGTFGQKPSLMSLSTASRAIDFLLDNSGPIKNLEVDFFGGEPLLVTGMLKKLVAYCRKRENDCGKRFNFTLTTNALLLDDDVINWVIENEIGVILSLDGRKAVNDRQRVLPDGRGSYDIILPRILKMVDSEPVSYYVRGTFTRENLDFADDLRHLIDLGFKNISLEPAIGPENGYAIQAVDLPAVLREYERLTDVLLHNYQSGREIHFFHYQLDLQGGPCLAKRTSGCGAGLEYLAITPEGDIFPCHQFVGHKDFYMGNVFDGKIDSKVRRVFAGNQLKDKECTACWARYFCGGGCHAGAFFKNGDINKPCSTACEMHRKRIEGAIYMDLQKRR